MHCIFSPSGGYDKDVGKDARPPGNYKIERIINELSEWDKIDS